MSKSLKNKINKFVAIDNSIFKYEKNTYYIDYFNCENDAESYVIVMINLNNSDVVYAYKICDTKVMWDDNTVVHWTYPNSLKNFVEDEAKKLSLKAFW